MENESRGTPFLRKPKLKGGEVWKIGPIFHHKVMKNALLAIWKASDYTRYSPKYRKFRRLQIL